MPLIPPVRYSCTIPSDQLLRAATSLAEAPFSTCSASVVALFAAMKYGSRTAIPPVELSPTIWLLLSPV